MPRYRQVTYLESSNEGAKALAQAAFPEYHGRKFRVEVSDVVSGLQTYWGGGTKDEVRVVDLATMRVAELPGTTNPFEETAHQVAHGLRMQPGYAVAVWRTFCGKDMGLTFYLHPDNAVKFLPAPAEEISDEERDALYQARALLPPYRAKFPGYVYESLIAKGFMRANRSITPAGKNALGDWRP